MRTTARGLRQRHRHATDVELVDAARHGDRVALDCLLERHSARIYRTCLHVLRDRHMAEDAAQEALLQVARRLDGFEGRAAFTSWMHRVVLNVAIGYMRRVRRLPTPVEELPERAVERGHIEDRLDVETALGRLPGPFREAVVLRDVCGLEYAEIASATNLPIGTVRSRIARGRRLAAALVGGVGERPIPVPLSA